MTREEQNAIIRAEYARIGAKRLADRLGMNPVAITSRAQRMGIRRVMKGRIEPNFQWTEELDGKLRELYPLCRKRGAEKMELKEIAGKIGCSVHQLYYRASQMGMCVSRNPSWTEDEDNILTAAIHRSTWYIQRKLKAAGFSRSLSSIGHRRAELGGMRNNGNAYSAKELSGLLGVSDTTVLRWIRSGLLKAKLRNRLNGCPIKQTDSYLIYPGDVRLFLAQNVARWNPSTADKYWLIDVLCGYRHIGSGTIQHSTGFGDESEHYHSHL